MASWVGLVARALAAVIVAISVDAFKGVVSSSISGLTTPPPDREPVKQCLLEANKFTNPIEQVRYADQELRKAETHLESAIQKLASTRRQIEEHTGYDPEETENRMILDLIKEKAYEKGEDLMLEEVGLKAPLMN